MNRVYEDPSLCCGCGACSHICSRNAITMEEDSFGDCFPRIAPQLCVDCGLCTSVCPMTQPDCRPPLACYAGVHREEEKLLRSSSGGVFRGVAEAVLKNGGLVCGAVLEVSQGKANVAHKLISTPEELTALQGSKYTQSNVAAAFPQIKQMLKSGKQVLFAGTPCQVAAVRRLFDKKWGESLFTMDLVCHGISNAQLFRAWMQHLQNRESMELTDFVFRDKNDGWGYRSIAKGIDRDGKEKTVVLQADREAYYDMFLKGETLRQSCYRCPFAKGDRPGDISVGDFWGIEKTEPDMLTRNGGEIDEKKGVCCVLVNTEKGQALLEDCSQLTLKETRLSRVTEYNRQLRGPSTHTDRRYKLRNAYEKGGYGAMEKLHYRWRRTDLLRRKIKKLLRLKK